MCVVPFAVLFLYVSHLPIAAGTWQSVVSGEQILRTGLTTEAPGYLPLAEGFDVMRVGWLSDVLYAGCMRLGGPAGVSMLSTCLVTLTALAWFRLLSWYVLRRRMNFTALTLMAAAWWPFLNEPQAFLTSSLCLAVFCRLVFHPSRDELYQQPLTVSGKHYLQVAVVLAIWANLSASFVLGLIVLLALALERFLEGVRTARNRRLSLIHPFADASVQRAFWFFEIAALATLLNPYGVHLWTYLFRAQQNPLVAELGGSGGLQLASLAGLLATLAVSAFIFASRNQTIRIGTVLSLIGGLILVAFFADAVVWFVPLVLCLAARTAAGELAIAREIEEDASYEQSEGQPLQFAWSLIAMLLVWCGFALSPFSDPILAGRSRPAGEWLSSRTPIAATEALHAEPDSGLVCAPADWAAWIVANGESDTQVFCTERLDLLSVQARRDYFRILGGEHNWQKSADRYAVSRLVVDKSRQSRLIAELRRSTDWNVTFEDNQALIAVRKSL